MRVALTGVTGYTGSAVLKRLVDRGDIVRVLARGAHRVPSVGFAQSVQVVEGSLGDRSAARQLVEGASAVIHVAAVYRTAGHADSYYRDVNVDGVEVLIDAAARAGVHRFVHTSTVGVHGDVRNPPADETAPFEPSDIYQVTKAEGEKLAHDLGRRRGVPVTVLRPGAIYGPGETRLLKLFRSIARGRYAIVGSGEAHYHLVHIEDLVDGFLLALEKPEAVGESFIIAGPRSVSQNELASLVATATGGRVAPFHLPAWPIQRAGDLVEALCKPFGIDPPLHRRRVDFWVKNRSFSIEKARKLLGYSPKVTLEEGIQRTAEWYRMAGWL